MTHLSPMDIMVIQNAIEEYSRKYPGRPAPSAEEALAWKFVDRGRRKREWQASATEEGAPVRLFEILRGWWDAASTYIAVISFDRSSTNAVSMIPSFSTPTESLLQRQDGYTSGE